MRVQTFLVAFVSSLLMLAGSATAVTTTYIIGDDNVLGLSGGYACLSSTDGSCSDNRLFSVAETSAVSGSFSYNDGDGVFGAATVDIDITLTTATMSGNYDGVSGVVFSTVN